MVNKVRISGAHEQMSEKVKRRPLRIKKKKEEYRIMNIEAYLKLK